LYPPGPQNPHYEKAMEQQAQRKGAAGAVAANSEATEKKEIETVTSPGAKALQDVNGNLTPQQKKQLQAQQQAAGIADRFTSKMMEQELDENEPPRIKLGDASVAAPFTSKLANVVAIPNIIRQGRLEGLSKERPQPNIFNPYIIGSVLGQFAIHIVTLIYISKYVQRHEPRSDDIDLEGEFEPSLLNSAVYLLQLIQQISTFAINYQGRPFREGIRENRGMYYGLLLVSGVAFSCSTEFIPEINEKLKLVPFTTEFKLIMTTVMVVDYVGCFVIEKVLKHLYSDFRPKDIAVRRDDQLRAEESRKAKEALEALEESKTIVSNGVL
ncbi:hypothetical protein P7C71_g6045, partial [Lecanoromycetidae sp. Uapishka_2]